MVAAYPKFLDSFRLQKKRKRLMTNAYATSSEKPMRTACRGESIRIWGYGK